MIMRSIVQMAGRAGVCAALALAAAACSSPSPGSAARPLLPGDLVSEAAAQQAIPHGQVLESEINSSLSGQAGSTLAGLCGTTFASESKRQSREQVDFTIPVPGGPGGTAVAASNELVRYTSGGATEAYNELKSAVASCPSSYQLPHGDTYSQNQQIAPPAGDAQQTVADAQFISQQPQSSVQVWEVNIFQFEGNYLSAIYAFDPAKATAMSEAESLSLAARAELTKLAG